MNNRSRTVQSRKRCSIFLIVLLLPRLLSLQIEDVGKTCAGPGIRGLQKARSPHANIMEEPPLLTKGNVTPVKGRMSMEPKMFNAV